MEQRLPIPAGDRAPARPWAPEFTRLTARGEQRSVLDLSAALTYAVVDDLREGTVSFRVSKWPNLDEGGRLVFDSDAWTIVERLDAVQSAIDGWRRRNRQQAPERPLRVGDVFAVVGVEREGSSVAGAKRITDVSAAARDMAKAALFGAAASTVREDYLEATAVEPLATPEARLRGVFDVRQRRPESPPPGGVQ